MMWARLSPPGGSTSPGRCPRIRESPTRTESSTALGGDPSCWKCSFRHWIHMSRFTGTQSIRQIFRKQCSQKVGLGGVVSTLHGLFDDGSLLSTKTEGSRQLLLTTRGVNRLSMVGIMLVEAVSGTNQIVLTRDNLTHADARAVASAFNEHISSLRSITQRYVLESCWWLS